MAATHESETEADIPSNPGKPTLPAGVAMTFPSRSVSGPPGLMTGST
jgi:hypothetical protein